MDRQEYLTGIGELYAAEVLGEGLANRWIQLTTDPIQKYKLGLFLQLESEAKVRLRPLLARHGISLVEEEQHRAAGAAAAEQICGAIVEGGDGDPGAARSALCTSIPVATRGGPIRRRPARKVYGRS
jgi:hypothetical protein